MSRLERWSRIKRNVHKEEDAPPSSVSSPPADETLVEPSAALHNKAEQLQSLDDPSNEACTTSAPPALEPEPGSLDHTLPDPETLEAGSDFSAFMAPGVSGPLRRQALKRLWATGNYNVRDGLDDYDADYNKLLKPMTSELASKLRRWTHKVEEAVDKQLDDMQSEPQTDVANSEQINERVDASLNEKTAEQKAALEQESSTSCAAGDNVVENISLDDQSDYLTGTQTKI
ncbi:MAG TPA: DUF3306 domain-containing protein [Halomonas sp.]|nr:DUF3306 domain-containing protein [Halomonas sp.]